MKRSRLSRLAKRGFDVAVAGAGLVALAPALATVALAIRVVSPGPILFRQVRVGRDFRSFEVLKFRTMVVDAARMGTPITAGADPRITSIGRVLRRYKLDELPQLVNVLRGDMSLVGPRPEVPDYVERFRDDYRELLRVRPGITDPASLAYRSEQEMLADAPDPIELYVQRILPDKIRLSKQYLEDADFMSDLLVILRTLRVLPHPHTQRERD